MAERCMILFAGPLPTLEQARAALAATAMSVEATEDRLLVRWRGGPVLTISRESGDDVAAGARELAGRTAGASGIASCDSRFVVLIADLDAVLDESNTLIETQMTLQTLARGWIVTSWNDVIGPPDEA